MNTTEPNMYYVILGDSWNSSAEIKKFDKREQAIGYINEVQSKNITHDRNYPEVISVIYGRELKFFPREYAITYDLDD